MLRCTCIKFHSQEMIFLKALLAFLANVMDIPHATARPITEPRTVCTVTSEKEVRHAMTSFHAWDYAIKTTWWYTFPWNKGISLTKPPFGVRSCEVAIGWPDTLYWLELVQDDNPIINGIGAFGSTHQLCSHAYRMPSWKSVLRSLCLIGIDKQSHFFNMSANLPWQHILNWHS